MKNPENIDGDECCCVQKPCEVRIMNLNQILIRMMKDIVLVRILLESEEFLHYIYIISMVFLVSFIIVGIVFFVKRSVVLSGFDSDVFGRIAGKI